MTDDTATCANCLKGLCALAQKEPSPAAFLAANWCEALLGGKPWIRKAVRERAFSSPGEPKEPLPFFWAALKALAERHKELGLKPEALMSDVLKQVESSEECPFRGHAAGGVGRVAPPNERAFELAQYLVRLFYVDGLAVELLDAWKEYERILYATNLRYRDHYLHLLQNFYLGSLVLTRVSEKIRTNWKHFSGEGIDNPHFHVRIMRTWLIAALFHDVGYPAEKLKELHDTLQRLFFDHVPGLDLDPIKLKPAPYIDDERNDLLVSLSFLFTNDEFSFTFEKFEEFKRKPTYPEALIFGAIKALLTDREAKWDHGVMSALFLMLTLKVDVHELTREAPAVPAGRWLGASAHAKGERAFHAYRAEVMEDVATAALAISLHNLSQHHGLTIDFRTHPTAFLLRLCDELQEWDRRTGETDWVHAIPRGILNLLALEVVPRGQGIARARGTIFEGMGKTPGRVAEALAGSRLEQLRCLAREKRKPPPDTLETMHTAWKTWLKAEHLVPCCATEFPTAAAETRQTLWHEILDWMAIPLLLGADLTPKDRPSPRTPPANATDLCVVLRLEVTDVTKHELVHYWSGLAEMCVKNLSWGPTIYIELEDRRQAERPQVRPFFAAYFDPGHKIYHVLDSFNPERRRPLA